MFVVFRYNPIDLVVPCRSLYSMACSWIVVGSWNNILCEFTPPPGTQGSIIMIMYDHVRPSSKIFKDLQSSKRSQPIGPRNARRDTSRAPRRPRGWPTTWCTWMVPRPLSIRSLRRERRKSSEKGAAFEVFEVEAVARCSVTDFLIFLEVWVLNGSIVKEKRRDGPNHDLCTEPWYPWCVHRFCSQLSRKGSNHSQEKATT